MCHHLLVPVNTPDTVALRQMSPRTHRVCQVFAVGQYNLVSMFLNTMQVERDEGVVGFPDRVSETSVVKARL